VVSSPYAIWSRLVVRSNPSRIYLPMAVDEKSPGAGLTIYTT
jgi:hypothetical protein